MWKPSLGKETVMTQRQLVRALLFAVFRVTQS